MSDSQGLSKAAKKNLKRKAKKKEGSGASAGASAGDSSNSKTSSACGLEPREILEGLKVELSYAKERKDFEACSQLRKQIWVLTDIVAGVQTDMPEEELNKILLSIPALNLDTKPLEPEVPAPVSRLSEPEKKIRALKKKLEQIERLKALQDKGEKMQENQLKKINAEVELLQELQDLELAMASVGI